MTYQQKFEAYRKEFAEKSDSYIKADKALSEVNGFGDLTLIAKFADAKQAFEIAGNNYHNFIVFAEKNNKNPCDEFGN